MAATLAKKMGNDVLWQAGVVFIVLPTIINLLIFPDSYWLYRKRIIYHQAGIPHIEEIPIIWNRLERSQHFMSNV